MKKRPPNDTAPPIEASESPRAALARHLKRGEYVIEDWAGTSLRSVTVCTRRDGLSYDERTRLLDLAYAAARA